LGREPLGFLSPVVALVTICRKGDETHHTSKEWSIKCITCNYSQILSKCIKQLWDIFKQVCYQTIMKFANENVSKWTIKSYYWETFSLLMRRVKFIYYEEVSNTKYYQELPNMLLNRY